MNQKKNKEHHINIRLISDNPDDVPLIQQAFEKNDIITKIILYETEPRKGCAETSGCDGIIIKNQPFPDIISIPSLLLIQPGNEKTAAKAIKAGADNYLIMDKQNNYLDLLPTVFMKMIQKKNDHIAREQAEKSLRESEEKYRSMAKAIPDPMYICSSDFRITFMNPAMIKRIGRDAIGEHCYKAVHKFDKRCTWCFYEKILKGINYEVEVNNPNDGRYYHISNSPVFHEDGSVSKMTILRDITEKKENEALVKKAKEAAEAANRVKSEFMENMSHEIRTPMNSVIGMIDLALNTNLNSRQRDFLETARISADSLMELLNDILELSEMEISRNMKLDEKDIEIRHFMETLIKCLLPRVRQKDLDMTVNISHDVPDFIKTDSRRLRQILKNLIRNAIKFTEKGKIEIHCKINNNESRVQVKPLVQVSDLNQHEFYLLFAVSDTGIGIAPDRIENIFERFTQVDSSFTRRFGGTGMGTTLSKHLTEMMGGNIWVKSELGKGSTFYFTIKTGAGKRVKISEPVIQKPCPKPEKYLRILLAEDNLLNQKLVTTILDIRGHKTAVVANGREALESFEKEHFDLILMDIQMPEMDGLEATRQIREKEKSRNTRIPIVAITAHAMQRDKEQCIAAGMDAYLSKPIRHDHFLATIESLVTDKNCGNLHDVALKSDQPPVSSPDKEIDKDVFNIDSLLEIVGGSDELIAELIILYMKNLPNLVSKIKEAIDERDSKKLEFNAHSLKGMSLNLSAKTVANLSLELEKIGRSKDISHAAEIFAKLDQESEKLKKVLNSVKNEQNIKK